MQKPLQITFRGLDRSEALESRIRAKTDELERHCSEITSCHVAVEAQQSRHRQGNLYSVHVEVHVPDGEVVASRDRGERAAHEDAHVAVRDAFAAARRQLDAYVGRRRER